MARRALRTTAARLAFVGLCSLAPVLVYYPSELKQYGRDATATLVLLAAYSRRDERHGLWVLGACGVAVVWFSHPAAIVMVGVFAALAAEAVPRRDRRPLLAVGAAWGATGVVMLLQVSATRTSEAVRAMWHEGYAPSPFSADGIAWYGESALGLVFLQFRHREIAPPQSSDAWFDLGTYALLGVVVVAIAVLARARRPSWCCSRRRSSLRWCSRGSRPTPSAAGYCSTCCRSSRWSSPSPST